MFQVGPTFFSSPAGGGDHPAGDGLTRLQTAFDGGSSADISPYLIGSGVQTGGAVGPGAYTVVHSTNGVDRSIVWTDAGLRRLIDTPLCFEFLVSCTTPDGNAFASTQVAVWSMGGATFYALITNVGPGPVLQISTNPPGGGFETGLLSPFIGDGLTHIAVQIDLSNTYSIYVKGQRQYFGSIAGVSASEFFRLGGTTTRADKPVTAVYTGARVRRDLVYSGASFTPPASPDDWGPP